MKTAIEAVLMVADYSSVPPFTESIAVAEALNRGLIQPS